LKKKKEVVKLRTAKSRQSTVFTKKWCFEQEINMTISTNVPFQGLGEMLDISPAGIFSLKI
jgi:hypothetical protein